MQDNLCETILHENSAELKNMEKLPTIARIVIKCLEFAENHDESELQNYGPYRSFKAKKLKIEHRKPVELLVERLEEFEFREEHIFWSKKLLQLMDPRDVKKLIKPHHSTKARSKDFFSMDFQFDFFNL